VTDVTASEQLCFADESTARLGVSRRPSVRGRVGRAGGARRGTACGPALYERASERAVLSERGSACVMF